jgi:GNAT superfamily N-acetyltransferase
LPAFELKPGFEFRRIAPGDSISLGGLWSEDVREYKTQIFGRKLNSDVICIAVMDGKQVVALDWFSHHRAVEKDLGIEVEMSPEVCFGYDLHEHPDYHSQGLGLALLSYTLKYARDLGYKRQYAIVLDNNVKMLSVATQLMGMRKVGQVDVARVLKKPFPRWNLNGLTGTRVLTLV